MGHEIAGYLRTAKKLWIARACVLRVTETVDSTVHTSPFSVMYVKCLDALRYYYVFNTPNDDISGLGNSSGKITLEE